MLSDPLFFQYVRNEGYGRAVNPQLSSDPCSSLGSPTLRRVWRLGNCNQRSPDGTIAVKNDYSCKSLLNSKTISVSKKITEINFSELINSKNIMSRMKLQTLQILQFLIECRIMVGDASVHISKHSLFHLKITDGCRLCAYPSNNFFLSQDHGRLPDKCISKHSQQKLAHVLDSLVHTGNTRAVGTSTHAVACAFTSDPQPRLFEFTSL